MKRFLKIFFLLILLSTLVSCGSDKGDDTDMNNFVMKAEITGVGDRIEVEVYEAEFGNEGPFWLIVDDATKILNKRGRSITASELKSGDKIKITYSGQVMMSYPPQIYAIKIELI